MTGIAEASSHKDRLIECEILAVIFLHFSLSPHFLEISVLQANETNKQKQEKENKKHPPNPTAFCHDQTCVKYPLCVLSCYHLSSCKHRKLTLQNCQYGPPLAKATQLLAVRKWRGEQTVPQAC